MAWPYANGPRHIGHVAGFGVPADIFARYHRLKGNDVLMVSGTDEHGTPVMVAAEKEGVSPREIADRYSRVIREDLLKLGLSYDLFTRTTTTNHRRVVQDIFRTLYDHGYVVERTTRGAFSAATGKTLPDRYVEGTCPICGYPEARGDQCDNCGNQLDATDLIDPRSRIDGEPPEFRETRHLFLDLPAFREQLEQWVATQSHWRPNVRNFTLGLLRDLKPRPITRDLDWGVPVPVDGFPEDTKRIYVWFDAVVGYLSASIEWANNRGTPDAWRDWWQHDDAEHVYFMGKDNIVFHTVIWPSMLLGYGDGGKYGAGRGPLQLPGNVLASEFLTMEGRQFSTSRNVVIYVRDFIQRYDADQLRYYLAVAGPETHDSDFTWVEFVRRNNDELVAKWGNLVHRTLTTTFRHFGVVPTPGRLQDQDAALLDALASDFDASVGPNIEAGNFRVAIRQVMTWAERVNKYLHDEEPWKLIHNDRERAATVLYVALKAIDNLKVMFAPFLPFSSQTVHELLGYTGKLAGGAELSVVDEGHDPHEVLAGVFAETVGSWGPSDLRAGQELRPPKPLFRKLPPETATEELQRLVVRTNA